MQRLADHPVSKHVELFIMKYRKVLINTNENIDLPKVCIFQILLLLIIYIYLLIFFFFFLKNNFVLLQPQYDSDNRPFVLIESKYKINQYQYCFIIFLKLKKIYYCYFMIISIY